MVFVIRGRLLSETTNGGMSGFFNSSYPMAGDLFGKSYIPPIFPSQQEWYSLSHRLKHKADDLKCVAMQFVRLHGKQPLHKFRFYSIQWRIWAARFIQAAGRQCCRRKLRKSLLEAQDRPKDSVACEGRASLALVLPPYMHQSLLQMLYVPCGAVVGKM